MEHTMITQNFQNFKLENGTPGNMTGVGRQASGLMPKANRSFNSVFGKIMSQSSSSEKNPISGNFFNQKSIKGEKENSLVDSLLANIQLDGLSPGELEVDSKGLQLLEKLLRNLGFGEDKISEFISDLTEGGAKNKLSLSGVLTKLNSFLKSGESHDELAMSAIPAIESIITAMGIDPKDIETLLYNAGGKDGGLDLQNLIAGLKTIAADGNKDAELVMNTGNQLLLSGLGLSHSAKKSVSINDFIEKLEELVNRKSGRPAGGDIVDKIAGSFGETLKPVAGKEGKGLHGETDSFLNSHAFQKQQQALDEKSLLSKDGIQKSGGVGPEAAKFMVKDGAAMVDDKNLKGVGSTKQEDPGAASFKMGVAADALANKTIGSGTRTSTGRALPSYITNQVSMKIANAVKNGDNEFKIQIKPPEMGRLQISLEFTKTGLKVGILAEHSATRDMLLSNSNELKSILNDQGIRLEKVQVDVSGNFDQSMADAGRGSDQQDKREAAQSKTDDLFEKIAVNETIQLADEAYMRPGAGRLSLVV